MITINKPNETQQTLDLSEKIIPGRRYVLAVVGTIVPFDIQVRMPGAGSKSLEGFTDVTAADADTVILIQDLILPVPSCIIKFSADPGTYHLVLQEIKVETH